MFIDNWIVLSIIIAIITAITVVLLKWFSYKKINVFIIISITAIIIGICGVTYILYNYREFYLFCKTCKYNIAILIICYALLIITSKLLFSRVIKTCPNISYAHLIVNMNVILTIILSWLLFKSTLNITTFIGIIISLIGLTIVILNN